MLRRLLPVVIAGLMAAAILAGYNVALAKDITSDAEKLDQGANTIWMIGAFSGRRTYSRQEYNQLHDQKLHGFLHCFPVLLGIWVRDNVWYLGYGDRRPYELFHN
jgi:hypothetical protein